MAVRSLPVLDSRRLYYFHETARLGSFSKAEEVLNIAQPALSRQVLALEAELGTVLLQRHGRGVMLTDTGRVVFEHAAEMLKVLDGVRDGVSVAKNEPAGDVSLAVMPSFAMTFARDVIVKMRELYPQIRLRISEGPTGLVREWLLTGYVDVAIFVGPTMAKGVLLERMLSEQIYLVGAPRSPIMKKSHVSMEEVSRLPLILGRSSFRTMSERMATRYGVELKPVMEIDSLPIMKSVIRIDSSLFTILPRVALSDDLAAGTLGAVPIRPKMMRTLELATPSDKPNSLQVRVLSKQILKIVREWRRKTDDL